MVAANSIRHNSNNNNKRQFGKRRKVILKKRGFKAVQSHSQLKFHVFNMKQ